MMERCGAHAVDRLDEIIDGDLPARHDPRAVKFWGNSITAFFMETKPDDPVMAPFANYLCEIFDAHEPVVTDYGFPDFPSVRAELGLTLEDLAELWELPVDVVRAIEYGWKPMTLYSALHRCAALGISIGSLFHDKNFEPRPLTRIHRESKCGEFQRYP